jgi:hypothetical protein
MFKTSLESWLGGLSCWKFDLISSVRGSKICATGFRDGLPLFVLRLRLRLSCSHLSQFCRALFGRVDLENSMLAACYSWNHPQIVRTVPLYYHVGFCRITLRVILRSVRVLKVSVLPGFLVLVMFFQGFWFSQ